MIQVLQDDFTSMKLRFQPVSTNSDVATFYSVVKWPRPHSTENMMSLRTFPSNWGWPELPKTNPSVVTQLENLTHTDNRRGWGDQAG